MFDLKEVFPDQGTQHKELFSSTDSITKDRVLSVRVEESLYFLLESFSEKWNTEGVGKAVRTILSMFFLPEVYKFELERMKPEKLAEFMQGKTKTGEPVSFDRFIHFTRELKQYAEFLAEAQERSSSSVELIEQEVQKVERAVFMLEQAQETWSKLFEENEEKQK